MQPTNAKINLARYLAFSTVLVIADFVLAKNMDEFLGMMVIFAAACLNQLMLVSLVRALSLNAATGIKNRTSKMVFLALGKVILLVVALLYGVQIMGNRVIIPLLIYVLQIAVLYLSFKQVPKNGVFEDQGLHK